MSAPEPATRRTGRRPGRSGTREAILRVARERFREDGYDATSLRAVARAAGVDPALVVHFFGSKTGLFVAAMEWPFDPTEEIAAVTAGGLDEVGRRVATLFVTHWDDERYRSPIITLLGSATTSPEGARLLREFLDEQFVGPLMRRLPVDRPELRANLVASQLIGVGLTRYVLGLEPLAGADRDEVIAVVGRAVQRWCTAPWSELADR